MIISNRSSDSGLIEAEGTSHTKKNSQVDTFDPNINVTEDYIDVIITCDSAEDGSAKPISMQIICRGLDHHCLPETPLRTMSGSFAHHKIAPVKQVSEK